MNRRWLIRIFFISLCLVCAGAWVDSFCGSTIITYIHNDSRTADGMGFNDGGIGLFQDSLEDNIFLNDDGLTPASGWKFAFNHRDEPGFAAYDRISTYHGLGFSFGQKGTETLLTVPLWFPTLFAALLLCFAWRKTRPRPAGKAFPIEPATNSS